MTRKRILFMAEGITMTHFVRPAALAETLDPAEYKVVFSTPPRYHPLVPRSVRDVRPLWTRDPAEFLNALHAAAYFTPPTSCAVTCRTTCGSLMKFSPI